MSLKTPFPGVLDGPNAKISLKEFLSIIGKTILLFKIDFISYANIKSFFFFE